MPPDPDYLRRDLINQKMMRFNAIRFIAGVAKRYQLDLADEIGLMVYEESNAAWLLGDSPKMKERYDESVFGMIRRDRNHPSVAFWGLLNETVDGPVFRHAVEVLPEVRKLDDTRVIMLNSGRFDNAGGIPGIEAWRDSERPDPCVTRNSSDHVSKGLGISWQPGQVAFHPGPHGEYAAVRWTAPAHDTVHVSAEFKSIAEAATTDLHVAHNGQSLFDDAINLAGKGPEARFTATITVKAGDTLDSICGWGNKDYGADTTALKLSVTSRSGATWDLGRDFSSVYNPAGVWSYGTLKPGDRPDCGTFSRFTAKSATSSDRQHQQSGRAGLARHRERPASLSARAAHGEHRAHAAHPWQQRQPRVALGIWHRQRHGLVEDLPLVRAARQDRSGRRPALPVLARPVPGRLEDVSAR